MQSYRLVFLALALSPALVLSQQPVSSPPAAPPRDAVSSDDISVADGLQLPTFGYLWVLDTWQGVPELIQLRHTEAGGEPSLSLKLHHTIDLKGGTAAIRIHDAALQIFARGVSGDVSGPAPASWAIVRLHVDDGHRMALKAALVHIKDLVKGKPAESPDVISMIQQRIGTTDWYRVWPKQPLSPGEYAVLRLAQDAGSTSDDVYDFAIDPKAPENAQPLRSEANRQSE